MRAHDLTHAPGPRSRRAAGLLLATLVGSAAAQLGGGAGCVVNNVDFCAHPDPDPGLCGPLDAGTDGDASDASDASDAGDAGEADAPIGACPGECVPGPPAAWEVPSLVWMGPELQAPPCPDSALKLGYEGHADLNAPAVCGECRCDAPTGSCGLPATLTASSTACPGTDTGAAHTPFDPPVAWDGSCTTNDPVPAGQLCAGEPCVESITIAALALLEAGCTPTELPIPADGPATWGTFARMCRGFPFGPCEMSGDVCVVPVIPGFHRCVFRYGDNDCSVPGLAPYTEKHVFYDGFQDTRSCSPCTCSAPAGGLCTAEVSIYADDACASAPVEAVLADSNTPTCHDVIVGSALGSKAASPPIYTSGMCAPGGGEPMGSAEPMNPATFCCIPVL
jgi:hypothetical protein